MVNRLRRRGWAGCAGALRSAKTDREPLALRTGPLPERPVDRPQVGAVRDAAGAPELAVVRGGDEAVYPRIEAEHACWSDCGVADVAGDHDAGERRGR